MRMGDADAKNVNKAVGPVATIEVCGLDMMMMGTTTAGMENAPGLSTPFADGRFCGDSHYDMETPNSGKLGLVIGK